MRGQQHGLLQGPQEFNELGQGLVQEDGVYLFTTVEEGATFDLESVDLRGPAVDGDLRHHVHVEGAISTDGRQLDDVTPPGV